MEQGQVKIEATEWRIEKYEGKHPSQHPLAQWFKRWLPIRGKLPFEVIIGGDAKPTKFEYPHDEPYMEWLAKRYPRTVGRLKKRGSS